MSMANRFFGSILRTSSLVTVLTAMPAFADTTPFDLSSGSLNQNWSNPGLITANDNWSGVPSITGFRGDGLTSADDVDPRTVLGPDSPGTVDVNANQTDPNTFGTGGVAEFDITDDVVALQGSGTADAPYLKLYLDTRGRQDINVAYDLRDIDGSADNTAQQLALHYRVGSSGNFTNIAAGYVADATTANAATQVTSISTVLPSAANNQALVEVRIMTTNANGADEWVGVDNIVVSSQPITGGTPSLTINDVSVTEGDAGTTTASFTVSLSVPAGAGGVSFDIATADNTATTAGNDYALRSLTGQTIAAGNSTYNFDVTVNGDTTTEPNETFFVNVTNVTGATVGDGQGLGTINNDDVALTAIHDIQGPGASSPIAGAVVTVRAIVTAVVPNGFFVQAPDAEVDADPATSEALFVFTSSTPSVTVGELRQVTGTVSEFVPSADPLQPPLTQLSGNPTSIVIATGQPLPAPIPLTATFPDSAGPFDQLERIEGMRVSAAALTVVAPTEGNVTESSASSVSNGVFFGIVAGPRPFRESGIQAPDPAPSGSGVTIPPVPRFDSNPERIRVASTRQVGSSAINADVGATVSNLVGVLDYAFRTYSLLPDPGPAIAPLGGNLPREVSIPTAREFTVAAFNLERFFDDVNDPAIGEPVLTTTAFANRLAKASAAVRLFLRAPDILAVSEVENLATLSALANRINTDAGASNPQYQAFLIEGQDVGGIDVGFLVRTAPIVGTTPRVSSVTATQFGGANPGPNVFLRCPDSPPGTPGAATTDPLNDRPPLLLTATVNAANGGSYPVTVIANHLRSLNDVASEAAATGEFACFGTTGNRVREKRQQQAEFLASLVQGRQIANPNERIVLVGDFNAFEFNDGFADVIGTIAGTKAADNETAVGNDSEDLVEPNLTNLVAQAAATERYSFVFDGNAQSLDHALINNAVIASSTTRRLEHARISADFNETFRNDPATPVRLSDHDPLVAFIAPESFASADVSITLSDTPDPVSPGATLSYTIAVANAGPDAANDASFSLPLPANTTFASIGVPGGWTCTTPAVGANGAVSCSIGALANASSASFDLVANVTVAASATTLSATATASTTSTDAAQSNNSATTTTLVNGIADLSIALTDAPDPVSVGGDLTYTITVANAGPNPATNLTLTLPIASNVSFVSSTAPAGFSCDPPAGGNVLCTAATLASSASAEIVLIVRPGAPAGGSTLSFSATVASAISDPVNTNNSATTTTAVTAAPNEVFDDGFE
jgi:hypothetical protein